ncbi:hypothetical protein SBA4_2740009 [Candidatus Sulfopaludibacter sp. SbA4]|nr:hypothetical protein SBA4_2740009 [Candidatus Sulfopaludibacter sp. SbA4]
MFGCSDVAQALVPAASALMPTPASDSVSQPGRGVETSLDTAGTSVSQPGRGVETSLDTAGTSACAAPAGRV